MFYVINKKYEIVSKHKNRDDAIKAKSENDFVTDLMGIKVMIYGPCRAHVNRW